MKVESALVASIVLGKHVFEVLRTEASFAVVCHRVTAVLVFVHVLDVDSEEWIRDPGWCSSIAQVHVDDESCKEAEGNCPAPGPAATVCVQGPDDAVVVRIEVVGMLLDDLIYLSMSLI